MLKFIYIFVLTNHLSLLASPNPNQWFQKAVEAYDRGDYKESIRIYKDLIEQGEGRGDVYYNLGNAYYRNMQMGQSMASFLAARKLMPRNPDVKANLNFVHEKTKDRLKIDLPEDLLSIIGFWIDRTTPREILLISLFLWCLGFLLLIVCQFQPHLGQLKLVSQILIACSLLFSIAFTISYSKQEDWGAVVSKVAKVYSSPGNHSTVLFQLKEGSPFVLERSERDWFKITLSDGQKGWISSNESRVYGL